MNLFVKTGLILAATAVSGCATTAQRSEVMGKDESLPKKYNCEYKVLYKSGENKTKIQNSVKPYFFDGEWFFLIKPNTTNTTKVTVRDCKKLSYDLHHNFRIQIADDEQGDPRFVAPEVMAVFWTSHDSTFSDDSHGVACTKSVENSLEKNQVYKAFKYSCGHEYIKVAK